MIGILAKPDADRLNPPVERSQINWFVAHTRPRCEKKLAGYCKDAGIESDLPLYKSVRLYRRKKVVFLKPLFPGYVFIRTSLKQKSFIIRSDYVANWLTVSDQELFIRQLSDIQTAIDSNYEIQLAPMITTGSEVRIKSGPLQGITAWVEDRQGMGTVLLRLDFIGKAAAVKVGVELLELC